MMLIKDMREGHHLGVRPVTAQEAWRCKGFGADEWRLGTEAGMSEAELLGAAARALSREVAERVLTTGIRIAGDAQVAPRDERAGVCRDQDEDGKKICWRQWLECWERTPANPGVEYEVWVKARKGAKARGPPRAAPPPRGVGP